MKNERKRILRSNIAIIIIVLISTVVLTLHLLDAKIYIPLNSHSFYEPVTGRTFIGKLNTDFHSYGDITYYERRGMFLCSPYTSEPRLLSLDSTSVLIDAKEIYVNMTFMGPGAHYPMTGDYQLRLDKIPFEKIHLRKEASSYTEVIEIKNTHIVYNSYRSDNENKEKIVSITRDEYEKVLAILEKPKLVNFPNEKDDVEYSIGIDLADDARESIYIDGEEAFRQIMLLIDLEV